MNNLNSIIIEGTVDKAAYKKDPGVLSFTVGVNRCYKDGDGISIKNHISYFDVEAFGRLAEGSRELSTGAVVRVVGRMTQVRWEDKAGRKHSRVYIVAEHIEYAPGKNESRA